MFVVHVCECTTEHLHPVSTDLGSLQTLEAYPLLVSMSRIRASDAADMSAYFEARCCAFSLYNGDARRVVQN